jgi:hypothetical protein
MMVYCPNCSFENRNAVKFCANCGFNLAANPPPQVKTNLPAPYIAPQLPAPLPQQGALSPVYQQPIAYARPLKDRSVAMILEILPGIFGILGIGWMYSGQMWTGIAWLVGGLVWGLFALILLAVTAGFGCICTLPVSIGLIVFSANGLSKYTRSRPDLFGP